MFTRYIAVFFLYLHVLHSERRANWWSDEDGTLPWNTKGDTSLWSFFILSRLERKNWDDFFFSSFYLNRGLRGKHWDDTEWQIKNKSASSSATAFGWERWQIWCPHALTTSYNNCKRSHATQAQAGRHHDPPRTYFVGWWWTNLTRLVQIYR